MADDDNDDGAFNIYVDADAAAKAQSKSQEAITKFPTWSDIPTTNIFSGKLIQKKISADKIASIMENWLMSPLSVSRASEFQPKKKDVLVVAGPCSGGGMVSRIVRLLQSDYVADVLADKEGIAPMLESHFLDEDPLVLVRPQSSNGRVFQTSMTWAAHQPRMHPAGKYIVVMRHPLDLRASWIRYLEQCFNVPTATAGFPSFADMVTPDDFVNVPVTLCHTAGKAISYEAFVSDWIREAKSNSDNVLLVFYESALSSPQTEITRIAKFIGIPLEGDLLEMIIKDVSVPGSQPGAKERRQSCGEGGLKFSKKTRDTLNMAWNRIVTDVEPNASSYIKFYEMQNHHHLYPYPQVSTETRDAASNGRKAADTTAKKSDLSASSKPERKSGFLLALPNSIQKYRANSLAKKAEKRAELEKWKEQQKNLRNGATMGNVVLPGERAEYEDDDGDES